MAESKTFRLVNKPGMHIRPATLISQTSAKFKSQISLQKGGNKVNGRSPLEMLILDAHCGDMITVVTDGEDAAEMMAKIEELFVTGFGEA